MIDIVHNDILRYSSLNLLKLCLSPGLSTLMVYRMGRWLKKVVRYPSRLPIVILLTPFYWLLTAFCRLAYDIYLDQSAEIGPGLYIGHLGGIRLRNCRLGANCSIHQQVRLEPSVENSCGPIIGNCVWIGPHARIQGMLKVGNSATIAAGAVVKKDVKEGCLVLGNPARVVKCKFDNTLQ